MRKGIMHRNIIYILLLSFVLLLAGCIEYSEELWLNADGSGRMVMKIGTEESLGEMDDSEPPFDEEEIVETFSHTDGITVNSSKSFNSDGMDWVEIDISFGSFDALNQVESEEESGMIGIFNLEPGEPGTMVFTRNISSGDTGDTSDEDDFGAAMMESMFKGYKWTYKTHFPDKVMEANTTDDKIDEETNTVTWSYTLMAVSKKPQTMRAVFAASPEGAGKVNPLLIILGVVIVVVVIIALRRKK